MQPVSANINDTNRARTSSSASNSSSGSRFHQAVPAPQPYPGNGNGNSGGSNSTGWANAILARAQEGVKQLQQQWGVAAEPGKQLTELATDIIKDRLAGRLAGGSPQGPYKVLYIDTETNGFGKLGKALSVRAHWHVCATNPSISLQLAMCSSIYC